MNKDILVHIRLDMILVSLGGNGCNEIPSTDTQTILDHSFQI